jgi:SPX domain protein involved in polyphosphate accumulation
MAMRTSNRVQGTQPAVAPWPRRLTAAATPSLRHARAQFTRSTTKYWVAPAHIMRLKLVLLRHLPLLVYGCADPVSSGDISAAAAAGAAAGSVGSPAARGGGSGGGGGGGGARAAGGGARQHAVSSLVSSGARAAAAAAARWLTSRCLQRHAAAGCRASVADTMLMPLLLPPCVVAHATTLAVYFDNPQLEVYHTRLAREDGARLARMRCAWHACV